MIILLKRKPVLLLGSLFAVSLIFAMMPDATADVDAGVGEFRLGEVLDESIGWFIVVGLGAIFAGVISAEIKMEEKYLGHIQSSEWFNTAGRIIKTGLTAAAIVSAWTWAATLLQSSTVAYLYGISGPFWYASGATIQVLLFGILAIELKRKAPNAHTFLEIIRARFGNGTHKIFLGFALTCNMIVTGMLLLGGAAVVNGLTGMDITIAAFLIPVGVMVYTLVGGLKATFVADYMHTVIIYCVILTFVSMVFFISPVTGGIEGMYDKLAAAADLRPVMEPTFHPGGADPGDSSTWGNAMGAYLTMASVGGLIFGIINIVRRRCGSCTRSRRRSISPIYTLR
jgi:Na+/proline symporter